jgi:cytidine deaminase
MDCDALLQAAWAAQKLAYAPYSGFPVGAALLTETGQVFVGCNVENLSYGLTLCAERSAVVAAVAAGVRAFRGIAIVSNSMEPISPCGACRQVLAEFAPALQIVSETPSRARFSASLEELLPRARTGILDQR